MSPPPSTPLGSVLDGVLATDPDRVALVIAEMPITFAELDRAADRGAAGLVAAGLGPGDRLSLADDTSLLSVASLIGAARIGVAPALMNPRLTADELGVLVEVAGAGGVGVAGAATRDVLGRAGVTTVLSDDDLVADVGPQPSSSRPSTDPEPETDAVILFTSGTTGTPKPVPLAHALVGPRIAAYAPEVAPTPSVALMCVPFVHIGGMLGLLVALAKGTTTVVQTRFDAGRWLALVERHRVNTSFVVPTMLHRIVDHPDVGSTDLSSLTVLTYGAAPASPDLIRRARETLPGVGLANTFGQTETMGSITILPPGDHSPERLASVGRPLPGVEVRVVDLVTGERVAQGAVGELWVKSAGVVIPDSQAADPSVPEGWFRTGDLVSEDDEGYLYPAGRMSDTINRGGEKFSPAEVEDVVRAHPSISDVAVVGVPDAEMGSRVGAAVVVRQPVTAEQLRQFCTGRIAGFKIPERVLVVDELPCNDFGKIDRKDLRARFVGTGQAGD